MSASIQPFYRTQYKWIWEQMGDSLDVFGGFISGNAVGCRSNLCLTSIFSRPENPMHEIRSSDRLS
jgi:hypothetical protein